MAENLRRWPSLGEILLTLFIILVLIGLLFPAGGWGHRGDARRSQARNDVMTLLTAIRAYQTEYGALPLPAILSFEDEATQARLLRVLQGLDDTLNPRRIVFFEARAATGGWWRAKYKSGIHPKSGALIDPWGTPYRLRLDSDYDSTIDNPYVDGKAIGTSVIAWSVGRDGVQGSPGKENILEDSDDVVSWR